MVNQETLLINNIAFGEKHVARRGNSELYIAFTSLLFVDANYFLKVETRQLLDDPSAYYGILDRTGKQTPKFS